MERKDLEPYVGKYVKVLVNLVSSTSFLYGFFILHEKKNVFTLSNQDPTDSYWKEHEKDYIKFEDQRSFSLEKILLVEETEDGKKNISNNFSPSVPNYEYFGHELEGWISKPIQKNLFNRACEYTKNSPWEFL